MITEIERRRANLDAVASARIEGFEPTEAFDIDSDAVIAGTMTEAEFRERAAARFRVRSAATLA